MHCGGCERPTHEFDPLFNVRAPNPAHFKIHKNGKTVMKLEDMHRDQLAEYELRRLNFSDDNWRIGHNRESEAPARGAFSTSLTPMS